MRPIHSLEELLLTMGKEVRALSLRFGQLTDVGIEDAAQILLRRYAPNDAHLDDEFDRKEFAKAALTGILARGQWHDCHAKAFEIANDMVVESRKKKGGAP